MPFSPNPNDKKQIDVIAINKDVVFIIECKSSESSKKAPSYKDEFDLLNLRLDGFKKSLKQLLGNEIKTKFVFATRNLRIDAEGIDIERLNKTNSFHHNDSSFQYVNSLIKSYKNASIYQFMGLLFKNQIINTDKIEIPAIEGEMGGLKYYMFSIEPGILLKLGFILHRTKANVDEMPTYQRLLVPKRLKGITDFIDGKDGNGGGFFPNSIIVNFSTKKNNIQFESSARTSSSNSRLGILKLPNAYSTAYIIDGQHRLYGYANSKFKDKNTIPVVAFLDLPSIKQLEMFMDINQNQKAVSPSLKLTLEEDIYWDSDRADLRIKALRSSIIKALNISTSSPLMNKISIGEDSAELTFKPFANALKDSGLLPSAKGNRFNDKNIEYCLYNINNLNHDQEMKKTKNAISKLFEYCYSFVSDNYPSIFNKERYFIVSNRGTYAFINIIGSLNRYLTEKGKINKNSTSLERFNEMQKYLQIIMEGIMNFPSNKEEKLLKTVGASADVLWYMTFQEIINEKITDYYPDELRDWKLKHGLELQNEAREYADFIEKQMKSIVLNNLKILFGEMWEYEIGSIKRECLDRAEKEKEKQYKEFNEIKSIDWTEMLHLLDYKVIIEKFWTSNSEIEGFITFDKIFSLDIGIGQFNSKNEKTKWISKLNTFRNTLAHSGSKENGLIKDEVEVLKKMRNHIFKFQKVI